MAILRQLNPALWPGFFYPASVLFYPLRLILDDKWQNCISIILQ